MSPEKTVNEEELSLESVTYEEDSTTDKKLPRWIKVSAIAAASAVVGGLAAAWFYRKTLSRLQQADQNPNDSNFGISEERTKGE